MKNKNFNIRKLCYLKFEKTKIVTKNYIIYFTSQIFNYSVILN